MSYFNVITKYTLSTTESGMVYNDLIVLLQLSQPHPLIYYTENDIPHGQL